MNSLLLVLVFPVIWPFIAKSLFSHTITWKEAIVSVLFVSILVTITWQVGKYGKTYDVELWNGTVTAKDRNHDSYIRSYECMCVSYECGTSNSPQTCQSCQICYEDHYTVNWSANTTVGTVQFDYLDSVNQSVYSTPDPQAYKMCKVGEPATIEHSYQNFIKAVPESLFHDNSAQLTKFINAIPTYPSVRNFYRIDRVIGNYDQRTTLNQLLNVELQTLGKEKQVNIIVIFTRINDREYIHAVERAWIGGKKNDVIVFIHQKENIIIWADVITWAKNLHNEGLVVHLRKDLEKYKKPIDPSWLTGTH